MTEQDKTGDVTIYLEGDDGHQGNVLLRAFVTKAHRIELVLNKLERAYLKVSARRSDFEIIAADKRNPTTLTLRVVPHVKAYNPRPALEWGLGQIATVARGEMPDARVNAEIANDLVKLATKDSDDGYKRFWINGHTERVRFDDEFLENAAKVARQRKREEEETTRWHKGVSIGAVVGQLKLVDDIDDAGEFVIVPAVGPETITCRFPDSMRDALREFLFKTVRVKGALHYRENSPFPYRVDAEENGIEPYPARPRRRSLSELRGVFSNGERARPDWDTLLNGR